MNAPNFTLGIEEEFMVIDPETRALKSHISEMIKAQELELPKKVRASILEKALPRLRAAQKRGAGVPR